MRRKRKLLSTSSDRLARRNLTSTSPLLTREDEVEAIVDVAVVAVERDADVEAAVVVMVKDVHPTGSAAKVRRVNAAHQGSPGATRTRRRCERCRPATCNALNCACCGGVCVSRARAGCAADVLVPYAISDAARVRG